MRPSTSLAFLLSLLFLSPLHAAQSESDAIDALENLFRKTRAGSHTPTAEHLKTRRAAAAETIAAAKKFLADFPASKRASDANLYFNLALKTSALAGDTNSLAQLQHRARAIIADPKTSDDDKESAAVITYMAEWGVQNGVTDIDETTEAHRPVYVEGLFAAANAVPNKEPVLQTILLQSRSGYRLNTGYRRIIAMRVLKHPAATDFLKAEAEKILSGKPAYEIGKPIDLKFTATDGRQIDLAKLKGKVVLIDFWATWCGPCVGDFPNLKKTYEKYHHRGLEILSISLDDDKQALETFLKKNGPAPWPHYFDGKGWNNAISFQFGINAVPTAFLIDTNGNLVSTNAPHTQDDLIHVEPYLPK